MLTILIPAAGKGSRFKDENKPLIKINNSNMLVESIRTLDLLDNKHVVIVQESVKSDFNDLLTLTKECKILAIDYFTDGPASTALLAEASINPDDELVICNCDQIMNWNAESFLSYARLFDGCVVTYSSEDVKNSFARIDKNGNILEIREKVVISSDALVGIHYWKKASDFFISAKKLIAAEIKSNKEYYIAPTYNILIADNKKIGAYHISHDMCNLVGTPVDLQIYRNKNADI